MSATVEKAGCPVCEGGGRSIDRFESLGLERCADCGLVFLADRNGTDFRARYESESYAEDHRRYLAEDRAFAHQARQRIQWLRSLTEAGGRLLELGPARGHFLAAARDAGFEPRGVEPTPSLAEHIERELGIPVDQGFVEDAKLPAAGFDVVCMFHVLEHMDDPVRGLERVRHLLKPDGLLLVEVPNIECDMAERRGADWVAVSPEKLHISHFGPETLRSAASRAGLAVERIDTVSASHYVEPARRVRPRAVLGYAYRAARLRSLSDRHPSRLDNLRMVARPPSSS